jgi:hypothetical protein
MSIQQGEQLAAEGIGRAIGAADEEWKAAAIQAVYDVCWNMKVFNADDVFAILDAAAVSTHENRAFGAIMRHAQREGWCRKVTVMPEFTKSRRPLLHRTPLQNWESLICIGR